MNNEKFIRRSLAAILASQCLLTLDAIGEELEQDEKEKVAATLKVDEIIVSGSRLVTQKFIDVKRESFTIVDSIGEDEIASLPALTAGEVIKVLPGLSVFGEDIVVEGGGPIAPTTLEGRFASVRGVRPDLNVVLLDGLNLAIPNEFGRSNFLDWFPVNLSKRLEVIKSFTAENDGNAIGGIVNVVTRSGRDYAEPLMTFSSSVSRDEYRDGPEDYDQPFNISGVYAAPIGDKMGVAATLNYNHTDVFRPSKSNTARVYFNDDGSRAGFGFNNAIDADGNLANPGNGFAVPMINQSNGASSDTDRYGGAVKLDYAFDEDTYGWVLAAASILDQHVYGAQSDARQPFFCFTFFGCVNEVSNQTPTSGDLLVNNALTITSDTSQSHNKSKLYSLQAGFEKDLSEDWRIDIRGGWSRAEQQQFDQFFNFAQPARDLRFSYDLSDPLRPIFTYQDADEIFDPSLYELYRMDVLNLALEEDTWDLMANLGFNVGEDDRGWGYKAGLRFKRNDRSFEEERVIDTYIGSDPITVADVLSSSTGRDLGLPYSGNGIPVFADREAVERLVEPLIGDPSLFSRAQLSDLINDYALVEETTAAFFYARYFTELMQFNIGVRYEHTKNTGRGYQSSAQGELSDGTGVLFDPVRSSGQDGYWLPSTAFNYSLREDLILRLSYSESLGRPSYLNLAPKGASLVLPLGTDGQPDPTVGEASLVFANPDIKPRRSHNYDLSLEWYLDDNSLLSVSYFFKDIEDEIFTNGVKTELEIDGQLYTTNVTQVQNSASSEIEGVELILIKSLDFVPLPLFEHMGVSLNATFVRGEMDLNLFTFNGDTTGRSHVDVLAGQPEEIYNASIYYSDERFDINFSANYVDDYQIYINPQEAGQDTYSLGEVKLNLSVGYNFSERGRVFLQGNNLTSKGLTQVSTSPSSFDAGSLRDRYVGGRTLTLGVSYTF